MITWFKKHFIPHEGNNHRPHFLHAKNTRLVIAVVLGLELIVFFSPLLGRVNITVLNRTAAVLPAVLSELTNEERQTNNLNILKENSLLDTAATLKAQDMAAKGYFAHTSPEGKEPWYWLSLVGYNYVYAGENLAIDFSDSKDVTTAWMNSPTHRANIVKASYTEVGTGIATGVYQGHQTVFVVQLYANPKIASTNEVSTKEIAKAETKEVIATTTKILGAETGSKEKNASSSVSEVKPAVAQVEPVETVVPVITSVQTEPSFFAKVLSNPRHTMNAILLVVFAITLLALILNIFIKINHQHPDLITNGLVVVAVVFGLYTANGFINNKNVTLSTGQNQYSSVDFASSDNSQ